MPELTSQELHTSYREALEGAGVPANLAAQCADILVKDNPHEPNLGRSKDDQYLIQSGMEWMKAKGFFSR